LAQEAAEGLEVEAVVAAEAEEEALVEVQEALLAAAMVLRQQEAEALRQVTMNRIPQAAARPGSQKQGLTVFSFNNSFLRRRKRRNKSKILYHKRPIINQSYQ